jgi:hypothetical protein
LSKLGPVLALAITLLTGVTGYAADKVALSCSGTAHHVFWSLKGERNEENYPYHDSLTIDLDGRVVIWGSDTYPITEIERNLITFKGEVVDATRGTTRNMEPLHARSDGPNNRRPFTIAE